MSRRRTDPATLAALSSVDTFAGDGFVPYHNVVARSPKRASQIDPERRPFVAWDGEGQNLRGEGKAQSYVLFGASTGDCLTSDKHLHTFDILDFMVGVGTRNPVAFHVGFAFNYDANMILQSLTTKTMERLHKNGQVSLHKKGGERYHVQFRPSKWFSVTKYGPRYDAKTNPTDKRTVKVYDIFGFFGKSFIKAYEDIVGPVPQVIVDGKANRKDFANISFDEIETYWQVEIAMLQELAEALRRNLYGAGLRITQWHGPGALASFSLRQHSIRNHMAVCPPEVREAARHAYAGGRFEMFRLGRTLGPIYSVDINSAYPFAITRLPDLTGGTWQRNTKPDPSKLARFGVYRVRLLPTVGGSFLERAAGPLFHRDPMGNISFPWILDGWYWSPEVRNLTRLADNRYEIVEGWEYVGGRQAGKPLPFAWIQEVYDKRLEWKAAGIASQLALKLLMNSIYGKLAQRVGWNEEKRSAPPWHQLEWAGWVTSHCRAMLWDVMSRIPREHVIAVETDGLYTTYDPALLGMENSKALGEWEVEVYDEILYVQSGMAWLRQGDVWTCKRRGLDVKTFGLGDCVSYLQSLPAGNEWAPFEGQTTRFIGVGAALASEAPFKVRHCLWETKVREIKPGQGGKRIHVSKQCAACDAGLSAYDAAHDMSVRSLAYRHPQSHPHDIPWENSDEYAWRAEEIKMGEVVPV
jgi:DNA polymerase type B, organellar and viral